MEKIGFKDHLRNARYLVLVIILQTICLRYYEIDFVIIQYSL